MPVSVCRPLAALLIGAAAVVRFWRDAHTPDADDRPKLAADPL